MPDRREDPVALIMRALDLDEARAERVLLHTHWVDHQRAIARWGYPKDNDIPAPLAVRLGDVTYVRGLIEAERDEDDPDEVVLGALQARAAALDQ